MDRTNNNGEREETWCINNTFYISLNFKKKNQYMADMDEKMIMMIPSSNSENF